MAEKTAEAAKKGDDRPGLFARLALFFRQVVAELRKVVWPTRPELIRWSWVVIVFCTIMALIIAGFDVAFGKFALSLFG